jgi:hypothetical protein
MTEYVDLSPAPSEFPLAFPGIALHLGLYECTEKNWGTLLERAIAFDKAIGGMFTNHVAPDEAMARKHIGKRLGGEIWTNEQFAKHLRILGAPNGLLLRYQHVQRTEALGDAPCDVYVELREGVHEDIETRRVQLYLDGRQNYGYDGCDGEANEYEDGYGNALTVLNGRPGIKAAASTEEEFESIWALADSNTCPWVVEVDKEDVPLRCGDHRGSASWCKSHTAIARANFPRLYGDC